MPKIIVTSKHAITCPLDPIPYSLLQAVSNDIRPFLTALINSSLTSGLVPASFKTARIKLLLKNLTLDTTEIQNYRPISFLSFLFITMECAISNQLSSYLSHNNLLNPHQSGFKTHSSEMALLVVTESLRAASALSLSDIADSALSWFTS